MEAKTTSTSLSKLMAFQQKKMITGLLLVSVSICSFLFSSYSSSFLVYSQKHYQIIFSSKSNNTFAPSKNCLFLICNGLLVLLAKTSSFVRSHSRFDLNDILHTPYDHHVTIPDTIKDDVCDAHEIGSREYEDSERDYYRMELETMWGVDENEEGMGQEDQGDDEESSHEELNQKFEDFIKRMREEIIVSQPTQQLSL